MTSGPNQSNIGLLFDIQALERMNETQRKQDQKRKHQVKSNEIIQAQSTLEDDKRKKKRSDGKDVLSRRRSVVRAMMKKSSKNSETKKGHKTSHHEAVVGKGSKEKGPTKTKKSAKTQKTQKGKKAHAAKHRTINKDHMRGMKQTFNELMKIQFRAQEENWPEPEIDYEKDDVLKKILDRKNLVDCKATDEQLAKALKKGRRYSRAFQKLYHNQMPVAKKAAMKALAQHGYGAANKPEGKQDIDSSIYASIIDAIEVNEMLQQLGIKTETVEMEFQTEMGDELIKEADAQFKKTVDQINKEHHESKCQKIGKIIGDIIGAIFCFVGLPWIGVPIILAANGIINKWIADIAKDMGVPAYVVQSIIVALAIIVAIATFGAGAPASACIMAVLFVAGIVGWIADTIGVIATGQFDESKFPGWVTWAAMGVNIGLALLTGGESLLNGLVSLAKGVAELASSLVENIGELASNLADSISALGEDVGSISDGLGDIEMDDMASVGEDDASVSEESTTSSDQAAQSPDAVSEDGDPTATGGSNGGASTSNVTGEASSSVASTSGTPSGGSAGGSTGGGSTGSSQSFTSQSSSPSSPSSGETSSSVEASEGSPTTANSAAVRAVNAQVAEEMAMAGEDANSSAITSVDSASAPEGTSEAITETQEEGSDTRTMTQKFMQALRKTFVKLLEKLIAMQEQAAAGELEDAEEAGGLLKGAETAAEKAERITQVIERVVRMMQKIARWMMLIAQGAQAVVDFEIGQCKDDIGDILKDAAELTGQVMLFEQFVQSFNMVIKSTKDSEQAYAKDMADEMEVLGGVITSQRRSNNILMSA